MKLLKCSKCKEFLSSCEFSKNRSNKRGYQSQCKKCNRIKYDTGGRREYHLQYAKKNKDQITKREKQFHKKLKREVFDHYGGTCACCGESHLIFLTIDHVNNDGADHRRKQVTKAPLLGKTMYRWLKKNNYPSGFQVLCFNCNFAKSQGGCLHLEGIIDD